MEAPAEREDNTSGVLREGGNWARAFYISPSLPYFFYTSDCVPLLEGTEKNIANFATRIISPVKEITVGQCTRSASGSVCDKGAHRSK